MYDLKDSEMPVRHSEGLKYLLYKDKIYESLQEKPGPETETDLQVSLDNRSELSEKPGSW